MNFKTEFIDHTSPLVCKSLDNFEYDDKEKDFDLLKFMFYGTTSIFTCTTSMTLIRVSIFQYAIAREFKILSIIVSIFYVGFISDVVRWKGFRYVLRCYRKAAPMIFNTFVSLLFPMLLMIDNSSSGGKIGNIFYCMRYCMLASLPGMMRYLFY